MAKIRLDSLFVKQARANPDRVAILHRGSKTSYKQLDRRSEQIAELLTRNGVVSTALVALCMHRTVDMVACLLGILKAGAAYVPVDPEYPEDRIQYILNDSEAGVILTTSNLKQTLRLAGQIICVDEHWDDPNIESPLALGLSGDPEALAYLMYTSGTTGQPKGVMLSHTASALVTWAEQTFTNNELSCVAATSSICFDPSILEIFVPLCLGGSVVLKASPLEPFTEEELPTLMNVVPAVLEQLLKSAALPKSLRVVNVGGERVKAILARQVYSRMPDIRLYNHYGPTEATTCTTVAFVDRNSVDDPPIGTPICGARVYILDDERNAVGIGITGELYIAGPTVAKGYWKRPDLTAERFLQDHIAPSGERMYRTGDLGYRTSGGELCYVGRLDDQIKFRGVRIELSEIEFALEALPPIIRATVDVKIDPTGRERLVAYIEVESSIDIRECRRRLEQRLPKALLPSHFVTVQKWPIHLSGKVNRHALPMPFWEPPITEIGEANNSLEDLIADVFRYVTGVQHVGLDDNFFELGGDSLLAEEVMLQLEHLLGISIVASVFSHNPTPRLLTAACSVKSFGPSSHVIALQPKGHRSPLFCTPDVFGLPLSFTSLARALAPLQPVYGLSVGPLEASMIAKPSTKLLTQALLKEMQNIQPEGPYCVCGYSFGGTAAFDLAQSLRAQGQEVALILLDSVISQGVSGLRPLLKTTGLRRKQGLRKTVGLLKRSRREWLKIPQLILSRDIPDWVPVSKKRIALALAKAKAKYRYLPFDGSTLLIECAIPDESYRILNHDGMLGWGKLFAGPFTCQKAETSHFELMRDPYVKQLAVTIENFLANLS